ncbi:MAG: response regulator [Luteolibacter sp.]|jgi:CheY-like chemotaxis protein
MKNIAILCVEDEPEVREAILRDLRPLEEYFEIESAGDTADASAVLAEFANRGILTGLILCDHRLPGESGVEFLTRIHEVAEYRNTRKVLLTGQAGHQDTIKAVNEAGLNHYLAKPWNPAELLESCTDQLTSYVVQRDDVDPMPYLAILDAPRLLEKIASRGGAV